MDNQKQLKEAHDRFILAIKRARADGVNVGAVFVECHEQVLLSWVRCFGLGFGIVWVFLGPILATYAKIWCLQEHLDCHIPEDMVYWTCTMGFVSILAFGFDLVNPRTLGLIGLKKKNTDEFTLSLSGKLHPIHEDKNDGNSTSSD